MQGSLSEVSGACLQRFSGKEHLQNLATAGEKNADCAYDLHSVMEAAEAT